MKQRKRFDLMVAVVASIVSLEEARLEQTVNDKRQISTWFLPFVVFWEMRQILLEGERP